MVQFQARCAGGLSRGSAARTFLWLEWDCGTKNVRDLALKFNSYAHYIASREWVREHARVLRPPDISQQTRMLRVAQISLAHASDLMAWTTTEVLLNEHGPLGCDLAAEYARSQPSGSARRIAQTKLV